MGGVQLFKDNLHLPSTFSSQGIKYEDPPGVPGICTSLELES